MKYTINFVRKIREQEKKAETKRFQILIMCLVCFGFLCLVLLYSTLEVLKMERVLQEERDKVATIEAEYHKYQKTKMIVNKGDIELLDKLHNGRIFWTKKLAAMAFHLPEYYWITKFGYTNASYKVEGFGYITPEQKQLITLDDYLNELRKDTTFSDVFLVTFLNSTVRSDAQGRQRVSFDFSSETRGGK